MSNRIEGDLVVGRNIYAGGNLNIPGKATIKQNLKVDGWLDAKNIKHTNKGLFPSLEVLNEAYPNPKQGWYALVGKTIPANIYIVEDGEWKDSNNISNDLNVDLTDYVTKVELEAELAEVTEISNNAITIANNASAQVDNIGEQTQTNKSAIEALQSTYEQADNKISQLESTLSSHALNIEIHGSLINENAEAIAKHRSDVVKDVARLDAKNTEQDDQISRAVKNANDAIGLSTSTEGQLRNLRDEVEVKNTQVDNKIANIETANAKQSLWHEAHSIINLHRFVGFATVESSIFPEYMTQVPYQLIRNGLIVLINTSKGWEAWQLVDAEVSLTSRDGYKKLDWDNSMLEAQIKIIQGDVSNLYELDEAQAITLDEHGGEIGSLKASISALEGKVDALTLRLDSVDLLIREIELRLDAFNSRIFELENKV